ncbi:MAG TPA: hypothetical protein VG672_29220, partial [Bryobacteraceae bacterium]|nr:hypothetical protein [Bryobacteraceae bacterium]
MKPDSSDPTELALAQEELTDFLPATIIRAETALSRYPIHNLTKTEKIAIHIRQKGEIGETEIYWNVSPSREYGEPRQLAYKLDTLVINRRIDEAGRPIPKLIRMGSLRDICKELDLTPSGDNFSGIRTALLQNASAFITAKLMYRGVDRISRKFEAAFSRYSVVFTGEELPDGTKADAVYIFLNEHYWKLLNKAQFRPLDYDYQKNLKPASHRFYELLSYNIFGALSKKRSEARMVYSDYCLRAPQERYFDRAQVQKQMYKIHKPHLESQYLSAIRYERCLDLEGKPDWAIHYTPGARAKAQYALFSGRQSLENQADTPAVPAPEPEIDLGLASERTDRKAELEALLSRGISRTQARKLLAGIPVEQPVLEQLEWGDYLIQQSQRGSVRNPPGFYVHLIRENVTPPDNFLNSRRSDSQAEEERERNYWMERELELAYEEYKREEANRYIAENLNQGELPGAIERKKKELAKSYRNVLPQFLEEIATQMVRGEIARNLEMISFEEFR